ncbi:MAG: hypothetical protein ACP5I8_13240 [Phycisphaerae bacterium]
MPGLAMAITLADMAKENGILPVAGGWLDQTESFANACRLIWNDEARDGN